VLLVVLNVTRTNSTFEWPSSLGAGHLSFETEGGEVVRLVLDAESATQLVCALSRYREGVFVMIRGALRRLAEWLTLSMERCGVIVGWACPECGHEHPCPAPAVPWVCTAPDMIEVLTCDACGEASLWLAPGCTLTRVASAASDQVDGQSNGGADGDHEHQCPGDCQSPGGGSLASEGTT
ncbi:hypothetical protein KZZ07_26535, partial [Mameliella sp. CS4]|uniref:hypothetical protein n=1 Tax=Mameliella sp. CS4 TaxID=2862329 RepID=UPI001C5F23D5